MTPSFDGVHHFWVPADNLKHKFEVLDEILKGFDSYPKGIIYCNTNECCKFVHEHLEEKFEKESQKIPIQYSEKKCGISEAKPHDPSCEDFNNQHDVSPDPSKVISETPFQAIKLCSDLDNTTKEQKIEQFLAAERSWLICHDLNIFRQYVDFIPLVVNFQIPDIDSKNFGSE